MVRDKKGLMGFSWYAITYTFRMLIILGILSIVYSNVFKASAATTNMEHSLHSSRLLYSRHSVFLEDPDTGRVYIGKVDPAHFQQERLDKLFKGEPDISALLALQTGGTLSIDEVFYGTARAVYKNPAGRLGGSELTIPVIVADSPTFLTTGVMFVR